MTRPPSCSTCRFYAPKDGPVPPGSPRGFCRFRLPFRPRHPLDMARWAPDTEICDLHERPGDDRG